MIIEGSGDATFRIEASIDELRLLNNVLNEVAHGVDIDDDEFELRLGAEREAVVRLLAQVNAAVKAGLARGAG